MTEWYCVRCSKKLDIETDEEPAPIRVCDGCGVENYCRPVKSVPEETRSKEEVTDDFKATGMDEEQAEIIAEALTNGQEEVKDEVQSEDAEIPEEVVPAEQPTDGEPEAENETMTPEEKEIFDLKAKLVELEAKE